MPLDEELHYTIVDREGNLLCHYPKQNIFTLRLRAYHREPGQAEIVCHLQAFEFCQKLGIEMFDWLPWWQRYPYKRRIRLERMKEAARKQALYKFEFDGPIVECQILSDQGSSTYRTCCWEKNYILCFVRYINHSAKMFRHLYPEHCIKDSLDGNTVVYLLDHFFNSATEDQAVESCWIELGNDGGLGKFALFRELVYKSYYRPGLQQSIQHYLRTGELLEWSPYLNTALEGTALVIQEIGERDIESALTVSSRFDPY